MDDVILKGMGCWLLAIVESIMVGLAFILGHYINGIPSEIAVLISNILGASQVFVFLIIKYYFRISDEEYNDRE